MNEPDATWKGRPLYQCEQCAYSTLNAAVFAEHVRVEHAPPKENPLTRPKPKFIARQRVNPALTRKKKPAASKAAGGNDAKGHERQDG